MSWRVSLVLIVGLIPSLSFAASVGFPAQSLWLSDTKPSIGEKVRIHTVLYNGTDADISGSLTYIVDTKSHETKQVSLKSGESVILSSLWTATEGEHTFAAQFGQGESAETQTSASISISVDAPPSALQQTVTQAKDVSAHIASTSIPIVSSVANTVFQATESFRSAGVTYLENVVQEQSNQTQESEPEPAVLGTSTEAVKKTNVEGFGKDSAAAATAGGVFTKIKSAAAAGALFTFKSLWLFYPLFVILLLILFRWLYKWVTRPRF